MTLILEEVSLLSLQDAEDRLEEAKQALMEVLEDNLQIEDQNSSTISMVTGIDIDYDFAVPEAQQGVYFVAANIRLGIEARA